MRSRHALNDLVGRAFESCEIDAFGHDANAVEAHAEVLMNCLCALCADREDEAGAVDGLSDAPSACLAPFRSRQFRELEHVDIVQRDHFRKAVGPRKSHTDAVQHIHRLAEHPGGKSIYEKTWAYAGQDVFHQMSLSPSGDFARREPVHAEGPRARNGAPVRRRNWRCPCAALWRRKRHRRRSS